LNVFIDNVASLAIEQCFIDDITEIFSVEAVSEMEDDVLNQLGSESSNTQSERKRLKDFEKDLKAVQSLCRQNVGYEADISKYICYSLNKI
jgi:hypothetical protein